MTRRLSLAEERRTEGNRDDQPKNPADGAAQPSVDDRTVPSPNPPASDTPPPQPLPEGPGIGAAAWPSEQTTPVGRGEQTAGGTDPDHPHLFHLADWGGNVFPGGSLQGANSETGPFWSARRAPSIWRGWLSAAFEPHWHPSAWEINVILAGRSRSVFVGPNGTQDVFEADEGDVIFAPQGRCRYFENASATEESVPLIVFQLSVQRNRRTTSAFVSLSPPYPTTCSHV